MKWSAYLFWWLWDHRSGSRCSWSVSPVHPFVCWSGLSRRSRCLTPLQENATINSCAFRMNKLLMFMRYSNNRFYWLVSYVLHISAVFPLPFNNNLSPELKARSDVLILCSKKFCFYAPLVSRLVSLTSVHKWQDSSFSLPVVLIRSPAVTAWFIVNLQRKNHS